MDAPAVEFRTGLVDVLGHAAGWLRQAARRGVRVRVVGPEADLHALDRLLWTAQPGDFIAHAPTRADADYPPGFARTPIWLGNAAVPGAQPELLLNVGDGEADVAGYRRVIELVGRAPEAVAQGRQRWRWYVSRGITPAART